MPVRKCSNGKWRIGSGKCMYTSKEKAESAYAAYRAQKNESIQESLNLDHYGGWISPDNKIHYVGFQEHDDFSQKIMPSDDPWDSHMRMYSEGWVRFVYYGGELSIEGNRKDIRKTLPIWFKTAMSKDVNKTTINLPLSDRFFMFKDNKKLRDFATRLKQGELFEQQLNELKQYIDTTQYGGWISPEGEVIHVDWEEHYEVIYRAGYRGYKDAFQNGWVRFVTEQYKNVLNLEGRPDAIRRTFRYWWPTASQLQGMVYIDIVDSDGNPTDTLSFRMPDDRNELRRLRTEQIGESILKEYKELPNVQTTYGYWLHRTGKIVPVKNYAHQEVAVEEILEPIPDESGRNKLEYASLPQIYARMMKEGWVRLVTDHGSFYAQGLQQDLIKSAKYWLPTLSMEEMFSSALINAVVLKENKTTGRVAMLNNDKQFSLPWEKNKIIPWIRSLNESEGFHTDKSKSFADAILSGNSVKPDVKTSKYTVSLFKHLVKKHNGKWNEQLKKIKEKTNLSFTDAQKLEVKLESHFRQKEKNTKNGWVDYFVRIEEEDAPVTESVAFIEALGASEFMQVGRHLVELQPTWVKMKEKKSGKKAHVPKWDVFVDGRGLGEIIQLGNKKFKTEVGFHKSFEEAIGEMLLASGRQLHIGTGISNSDSAVNAHQRMMAAYAAQDFPDAGFY